MTAYRASYRVTAPIDDYFSNAPATTTHDFVDADDQHQHSEDTGTPTVGIYATDGIWDEEDSLGSTARYSSSMSAAPSSIKTGKGSMKSRSRSGTASPFVQDEEKAGIWGWAKRGRDSPLPERSPEAPKGLTKKESKAKLRGKGRRGELLVVVSPDENTSSPPPVPPTPQSYIQTPVTASPAFFSPPQHESQHDENDPSATKTKGSWKRGMQRMFRSKSSAALREISNAPNAPPVPALPSKLPQSKSALGQPFSASTPPSSVAKRSGAAGVDFTSPTPSGQRESYGLYPNFPADPFQSRLDATSKGYQSSAPPPRAPRHSPSLKSLKEFINPTKPKIAKSKSIANLKEPSSAPPMQAEFPPLPRPQRRMTSMTSLRQSIRHSLALSNTSAPVESPPLLPPNPPYFPFPTSAPSAPSKESTPSSLSIVTSFPLPPSPSSAGPMSPAPNAPLPPVPAPISQPLGSGAMSRSASGHKLLPRSRSTSMSLRSPPTSSSFFDLYEQLGIWPTPEKNEEEERAASVKAAKRNSSPSKLGRSAPAQTISNSSSLAFSSSSWEAAISAFPVVDADESFGILSRFSLDRLSSQPGDLTADTALSNVAVSASSASSTRTHTVASSSCTAGPSRTQDRASQPLEPVPRGRMRRSGGASGSSSRDDSRERKPSLRREGQWDRDSSDESSEEDDVPLSKLHPSALAAQQEKKARSVQKRVERVKAKANQIKLVGRNPGGGSGWNGEGGVPADILIGKLERLLLPRASPISATPSDYPWATATRPPRVRDATQPVQLQQPTLHFAQPHQRSNTEPVRSTTQRAPPRPLVGNLTTSPQLMMGEERLPSPLVGPSRSSSTRHGPLVPPPTSRPTAEMTRNPSSNSTHTQATISRLPPPIPGDFTVAAGSSSLSRSNTTASRRSVSRQRSRSNSTARHGMPSDENMIRAAAAEPMPASRAIHVKAFIGTLEGKKVTLEIYPQTTPRDVLSEAMRNGELEELGRGMSWVVVEIFAEIGCERQVREYEQLQTVIRGWDATAKYNCLVIKQTISGSPTLQRSIPHTAPYLGSWVQYESKKGKWSKRWLETRGGQVFLAKNEKNKEEVQINTLFFDVYQMTRPYPGPKPFFFVMKRIDPEASFQNPEEYLHTFSAEDGVGYKLMAAIYDAKSFALQPHLLARQGQAPVTRKPSLPAAGPLVALGDLKKKQEEKTGFTGKGLLRL